MEWEDQAPPLHIAFSVIQIRKGRARPRGPRVYSSLSHSNSSFLPIYTCSTCSMPVDPSDMSSDMVTHPRTASPTPQTTPISPETPSSTVAQFGDSPPRSSTRSTTANHDGHTIWLPELAATYVPPTRVGDRAGQLARSAYQRGSGQGSGPPSSNIGWCHRRRVLLNGEGGSNSTPPPPPPPPRVPPAPPVLSLVTSQHSSSSEARAGSTARRRERSGQFSDQQPSRPAGGDQGR